MLTSSKGEVLELSQSFPLIWVCTLCSGTLLSSVPASYPQALQPLHPAWVLTTSHNRLSHWESQHPCGGGSKLGHSWNRYGTWMSLKFIFQYWFNCLHCAILLWYRAILLWYREHFKFVLKVCIHWSTPEGYVCNGERKNEGQSIRSKYPKTTWDRRT